MTLYMVPSVSCQKEAVGFTFFLMQAESSKVHRESYEDEK